MTVNSELLGAVASLVEPEVKAIIDSITPYLPALKRCGTAAFNQFVDALGSQDWSRIDRALYEHMSEDERDKLSSQVLKDARADVKRAYETRRTYKTDLLKAVLGIAVSFA
jgi:hypothetical protein